MADIRTDPAAALADLIHRTTRDANKLVDALHKVAGGDAVTWDVVNKARAAAKLIREARDMYRDPFDDADWTDRPRTV